MRSNSAGSRAGLNEVPTANAGTRQRVQHRRRDALFGLLIVLLLFALLSPAVSAATDAHVLAGSTAGLSHIRAGRG